MPDEVLEVNLIGENGPENVSGEFAEFLETSQLSDLVIRCSDGRFIECHRLLLAARARNLRHFMSASGQFNLTELVFRNCVKFEHIQALVSLIYRGHINGQDHQITSTLWKLFKIFGIRVTAKCFKNSSSGSKELAHELKYDSVELNAEKGAAKFEKIIREFRSETRKRTRRRPSATTENADKSGVETGKTKSRKTATRPPGVIVISDEEQEEWSSASCSSSVSSLSSSSSDGESAANPQRVIQGRGQQTNGKARGGGGGAAILSMNSNSAIKTNKAHKSGKKEFPTGLQAGIIDSFPCPAEGAAPFCRSNLKEGRGAVLGGKLPHKIIPRSGHEIRARRGEPRSLPTTTH